MSHKKITLLFIIIFGITTAISYGQQKKKKSTAILDNSEWKTYCTGRYLIDLPSALNPEYAGGDSFDGTDIVWEKQFTNREQVLAQIEQMKENLNNSRRVDDSRYKLLPRKDDKPYLAQQLEYPNGGLGILVRQTSYSNPDSYIIYNYFITEKPFRVFRYFVKNVFDSNMEIILQRNQDLAQALRSREIHEIPKGPGLCIYGGFVSGYQDDLAESGSIKLNYPYYSKDYYFQIDIRNIMTEKPITMHPKKRLLPTPKITKVFRNSNNKTVAGLKGMECVFIRKNKEHSKIPLYDFIWHYPGTAKSSQDPYVVIHMAYNRGYMQEKNSPEYITFANSKEVLDLWDKILNSLRRRPE